MIEKPDKGDLSKEKANLLEKWIFVLLYSDSMSGVVGRIRFITYIFLTLKHFDLEAFEAADFYPHYFGPNSEFAKRTVIEMLERNDIEINLNRQFQDVEFKLSEIGKRKALDIIKGMDQSVFNKISGIKRYNNEISLEELLRYIYMDYPEYASKSKMKHIMIETADFSEGEAIDDGPGFVATNLDEEVILNVDEKTYLRFFL